MSSKKQVKIGLIGAPNSGKSSFFNRLTGLHQRIANYPGVTVSSTTGRFKYSEEPIEIVDLPGIYYLQSKEDEAEDIKLAKSVIEGGELDFVFLVVDSTRLPTLYLAEELKATGKPFAILLNMMDELYFRGGDIDLEQLKKHYGVPVFRCSVKKNWGISEVIHFIRQKEYLNVEERPPYETDAEDVLRNVEKVRKVATLKRIHSHRISDKLDAIFLHRFWGMGLFLLFVYIIFQSIFSWVTPLQDSIEAMFASIGSWAMSALGGGILSSMVNGILVNSLGTILVFTPQIAILFFYIGLMESSGYMARAAMISDRFMESIGLEGRSFFPLFSSYACAIPGVLATRSIVNPQIRLVTSVIAPFMTCSARVPVYVLFISAFIPDVSYLWGLVSLKTLVFFGLYFLGATVAALTSKALTFFYKTKEQSSFNFISDLPSYRVPEIKATFLYVWIKVKSFLKRVPRIILPFMIVLWFFSNFPREAVKENGINGSYLATAGKVIQPVFSPQGFDWKITVAIISSLAAREIVISTLALLYSVDEQDEKKISEVFRKNLSFPQAMAILLFFVFSLQCISTLSVIYKEFNSLKLCVYTFGYMFFLGYFFSALAFKILSFT